MLVCLACPKQANITPTHADDSHHHAGLAKAAGTGPGALGPGSREHIKSFTTQLKDIVMKFSTGAYRHCSPCTAAGVRGGGADEVKHNLCGEDDEKSSILLGSNSEDQCSSDHGLQHNLIHGYKDSICDQFGSTSLSSSSRHDLLPIGRKKRRHLRKKKSSTAKSSLSLKQLPPHPDSSDAIEELLNEHFRREERILAEEQLCAGRGGNQESRADHQLLEEAKFARSRREMSHMVEEHLDDDVHVKRSKRHILKVESGGGHVEEWVAQVEPGVMITFVALPDGSNHLKRIRFSRELFSKWQAQLWWAENNDMVRELYSVSKTEAPFKSCSSARTSSSRTSTTTSSYHQHTLQNTPELQSRVGSCQASPSSTPTLSRLSKEGKPPRSPTPCSPYISQVPSSRSISLETVDHHDNPLFDNPEFELCYNEGVKETLVLPSALWASTLEECSQQTREDNDVLVVGGSSPCELVHQLKRVKFIN